MKPLKLGPLVGLLFVVALGGSARIAKDDEARLEAQLEAYWNRDVEFNERLLRQAKLGSPLDGPVHEIPEKEPSRRRSKRDVSNNCDPGYTGQFCENPICANRTDIHERDITTTTTEKTVSQSCSQPVTVYIDSHMTGFIRITVQTLEGGNPGGQLYDYNQQKIVPAADRQIRNNVHRYDYRGLLNDHGPGIYSFAPRATTNEDCTVTVIAATPLVAFGGFVEDDKTDKAQEEEPEDSGEIMENVQRMPTQWVQSFYAFTMTNASYGEGPKFVSFHSYDNSSRLVKLAVTDRYNCNFNSIVGPYVCFDENVYFLKIQGRDNSGNIWQRVYRYDCNPNPDIIVPTGTPEPILACKNGGTIINQNGKNVCYCGPHFSGPDCALKSCDNGGQLTPHGACACPDGFSGDFCEHVSCPDRVQDFRSDKRGLSFVVRGNSKNKWLLGEIQRAAAQIISYFDDTNPGQFAEYSIASFINGGYEGALVANDVNDFVQYMQVEAAKWQESDDCEDKIFMGLEEAFYLATTTRYVKSPIFLFTDALPNDDLSARLEVLQLMAKYKSPVFIILYGGANDNCNANPSSEAYASLRYVAQYTHGLVVKVDSNVQNLISDTALALAQAFFNNNLLGANDLIDSCQYAPETHLFFVDESVSSVMVAGVSSGFRLRLIDTDGNRLYSDNNATYGDLQLDHFRTLDKGHYRLAIDTNGQTLPCHYRIYAQSRYEAFFAATPAVNMDRGFYQPIYNQDVHLVGLLYMVDIPDPENVFTEIVVWSDESSLQKDRRRVLYASNGIYRDGCSFNLYFGQWKCTDPGAMFYVNLYITDSSGFTVMRTTTGQCAIRNGPSDEACRNGGVQINNVCYCTAGWTGDKCQTAICYNGGTSKGDHCDCLVGYGGQNCELNRCLTKNDDLQRFQEVGRTVSLIIQKSSYLKNMVMDMRGISHQIVRNLKSTHPDWIRLYTFWQFDDKGAYYIVQSSIADSLIDELETQYDEVSNAPAVCRDLRVYEALIAALKDKQASKGMIVYLYVSGGLKYDRGLHRELFELIDQLEAKIHITQDNALKCGFKETDAEITNIVSIAAYSGGTYSMSGLGTTLHTLPLRYSTGNVFDEMRENCDTKQTFYFPVDSEAQTVSLLIIGEPNGDPTFTAPNGESHTPYLVYTRPARDTLYLALRPCAEGWTPFREHCYRFEPSTSITSQRSWKDARDYCKSIGGTLATIDNVDVDNWIKNSAGGFTTWIGLNDLKVTNTWEWDQGDDDAIPWDQGRSYNGFKPGEPNQGNGDCVVASSNGWYVTNCDTKTNFVCSTHAYGIDYNPGSAKEGHLPRGIWTVQYNVYTDDPLNCGLRVDTQSSLQLYRRFDTIPYVDDGYGQALLNYPNNIQIVHTTSVVDQFTARSALEYAHFYATNKPDLSFVTRLTYREHCTYEYASDAFNPTQIGYQVAYTGFDAFGYPYQRVIPTTAIDDQVQCKNGGVREQNANRCVCPPGWGGPECRSPICVQGEGKLAPNGVKCLCNEGYVGDFCQTPNCTRGSGEGPPPIANKDKTFALIIDGSFTGYNAQFLRNFKTILDNALGSLGAAEKVWFKNYVAVVAYDRTHDNGRSSLIINKGNRADFESDIQNLLVENWQSTENQRDIMRSLMKLLNSKGVEVNSPVYIITDSGISDPSQYTDQLQNLIAKKQATISTIILNDQRPPGGASSYRDDSVVPYLELAFRTGGGFYQVKDADSLAAFWSPQLASYFNSLGLAHDLHIRCADKTQYFQVGGDDTNTIIDIFSPKKQDITLIDPNNQTVKISGVSSTNTNYLFTNKATIPGIYRLTINHQDKPDFCSIAIRAARSSGTPAPAIGFNYDVETDLGYHSQGSEYAPKAGVDANSVIASSKSDKLKYVQVYTHDTRSLAFSQPLIQRTDDCNWNYVSKDTFTCPDASFTVAVEANDKGGHPYRRIFKTHCLNYRSKTVAGGQIEFFVPKLIGPAPAYEEDFAS